MRGRSRSRRVLSTRERASVSQDAPPGVWYADPYGEATERKWDGHKWTKDVRGVRSASPVDSRPRRSITRGVEAAYAKAKAAGGEQTFTCYRCRGTGRAYDLGSTCPNCMGKGRMTAEDRKANWLLRAIFAVGTVLAIVLPIVLHGH